MNSPFDKYLRSIRDDDSTSDRMRKLLAVYPSLGKGFVAVRKDKRKPDAGEDDDVNVDDLSEDDIDEINDDLDERDTDKSAEGSATSRHISHLADLISEGRGSRKAGEWIARTCCRGCFTALAA